MVGGSWWCDAGARVGVNEDERLDKGWHCWCCLKLVVQGWW